MRIAVFGYLSRDRNTLPDGKTIETVGGKGLYISAALAQSGVEVDLITWLPPEDAELPLAVESYPVNLHVLPTSSGTVNTNTYTESGTRAASQFPDIHLSASELNSGMHDALKRCDAVIIAPSHQSQLPVSFLEFLGGSLGLPIIADLGNFFRRQLPSGKLEPQYPWPEQAEYLRHLSSAFVSHEDVAGFLDHGENPLSLARALAESGPTEVIFTHAEHGSFVYTAETNEGFEIPAFRPRQLVDPTGAGDTYLGAYIAERYRTDNSLRAGKFSAMAATLKLNYSGPLRETQEQVDQALTERESEEA